MIQKYLDKVESETNTYAVLRQVGIFELPELLSELEVIGWNLKHVLPLDSHYVSLLLRRTR